MIVDKTASNLSSIYPVNNSRKIYSSSSLSFRLFCFTNSIFWIIFIFYFTPEFIAPIIWPKTDTIKHPHFFSFISAALNHQIAFIIINFTYFLIYKANNKLFEQYKVEKEKWPWESMQPLEWKSKLNKTLMNLFINHFIIVPLVVISGIYSGQDYPHRIDYESLPSYKEVIWQYIFTFIINDISFYFSHWLLHKGVLYNKIHKVHHENKITYSLAVEDTHWAEYLFGNIIAFNVGNMYLGKRMHLFSSLLFSINNTLRSTETHSGYAFPWSPSYMLAAYLKFLTTSDFHSFHHLKYKGNYGGGLSFDYLFGTVNPFYLDYRNEKIEEFVDGKKEKIS